MPTPTVYETKPYTPKAPVAPKEQGLEWAPLAGYSSLPFNGTGYDAVRKCLIAMYGPFPIRLSSDNSDISVMKAMMHAAGEGGTPYKILHDALGKYGEIEVRDVGS